MRPAEVLLSLIEDVAEEAREALADEHEAGVRRAVARLERAAVELGALVTSW